MPAERSRVRGFTIAEFLIVATVITVFIGGLLMPFSTYLQSQRVSTTQRTLELVRERLVEFAVRNGRLPCPADPAGTSGVEWVTATGTCGGMPTSTGPASGVVPWATLQTPEADAWGTRYTYSVQSEWADGAVDVGPPPCPVRERFSSFCSTSAATLAATTRRLPTGPATSIGMELAAVVISHGPNAQGGYAQGGVPTSVPVGGDESQNRLVKSGAVVQPIGTVVVRDPTPEASPCNDGSGPAFCGFDDRIVMIGKGQLVARMLAEGRLQ